MATNACGVGGRGSGSVGVAGRKCVSVVLFGGAASGDGILGC